MEETITVIAVVSKPRKVSPIKTTSFEMNTAPSTTLPLLKDLLAVEMGKKRSQLDEMPADPLVGEIYVKKSSVWESVDSQESWNLIRADTMSKKKKVVRVLVSWLPVVAPSPIPSETMTFKVLPQVCVSNASLAGKDPSFLATGNTELGSFVMEVPPAPVSGFIGLIQRKMFHIYRQNGLWPISNGPVFAKQGKNVRFFAKHFEMLWHRWKDFLSNQDCF